MEDQPEKRKLDSKSSEVREAEKKRATGEKKVKKEEDAKATESTVTLNMSCPQSRVGGRDHWEERLRYCRDNETISMQSTN